MGIGYETEKGSVRGDRGVEEVGQEGSCGIKAERRLLRMEGKGEVGDGEEAGRRVLHCWESTLAVARAGKRPTSDSHSSLVQVPASTPGGCWRNSEAGRMRPVA